MEQTLKRKVSTMVSENPSSSGLIDLDNLPQNCFHLGQNAFIVISSFGEKQLVHLRTYTAYGKKCYPSKVGVTMSLTQWMELVKNCEKISNQLSYGIFMKTTFISIESIRISVLNPDHQVAFYKEITSKTGTTFKSNITISEVQWNELVRIATDVSNCVIDVLYESLSFETSFKSQFPNHEFPQNAQFSDCREILLRELKSVIRKHIMRHLNETTIEEGRDLLEVIYDGDSFNCAVLGLDLDKVAEEYASKTTLLTSNDVGEKSVELIKCIDESFLKSVKMNEMINIIRKELHQPQDFD